MAGIVVGRRGSVCVGWVAVLWGVVLALVAAGCVPQRVALAPATTELRGARVEVPMVMGDAGVPEVRARVGAHDARCVLDTGAALNLLSADLALGAPVRYHGVRFEMVDAGGNKRKTNLVQMPGCVLGDGAATFGAFDGVVTDLGVFSGHGKAKRPVDLVVNTWLFYDCLVTVDYPRNRLVLERGELPPANYRDVLPLAANRQGHLFARTTLGGRPLWLMLDTGFSGGLVLPTGTLPDSVAGATLVEGLHRYWYGTGSARYARMGEDLHVGGHVIARPIYTAMARTVPTMGSQYMRHFAVTFDLKNGRVRFARPAGATGPIEVPAPRMLAFHISMETGAVIAVKQGGTAQRVGVRVGDTLLMVDGVALTEYLKGKRPKAPLVPGHYTFQFGRADGTRYAASIPVGEMGEGR